MEISLSRYASSLKALSPEELSSLFVHSEYTEDEKNVPWDDEGICCGQQTTRKNELYGKNEA